MGGPFFVGRGPGRSGHCTFASEVIGGHAGWSHRTDIEHLCTAALPV